MGDLNGHAGRNIDGFLRVHGGFSIDDRNKEGRMLSELCNAKYQCMANTWLRKAEKKKIIYGSGCNKNEIDIFIMEK